jgi:hypothetical protein
VYKLSEGYACFASLSLTVRIPHRFGNLRAIEPLGEPRAMLIALAAKEADAGRTAIRVHLDHACADLMRRDDALAIEADREHYEAPGV